MSTPLVTGAGGGGLELLVEVAQQRFRCRVGHDSDVCPRPTLTPIPRMPGWLAGLTMGHDRVIPVVDLSRLLGIGTGDGAHARMLTFEDNGLSVGFLVDDVRSVGEEELPTLDLANVAGALSQRLRHSLDSARAGTSSQGS